MREVALSVGFRPLAGLRAVQLGPLWDAWRYDYPILDEQPPLPPIAAPDLRQGLSVSFGSPPINRQWFLSSDRDRLVQLQADRLVVNWRAIAGQSYPRYTELRREFAARLGNVGSFSAAGGWGELTCTDVELTYVNLIVAADGAPAHAEDVLTTLVTAPVGEVVGELIQSQVVQTFWPPEETPALDLTVSAGRGSDAQGAPALLLTLAVRGALAAAAQSAALTLLDAAHVRLVRGFAALTRPTMHQLWGRTS